MPDPLVTSVTLEEASECPRVIHVDRTKLLERASLTQRQRRREESEERRLGNRQSSWLFNGTKRSREETLEPPSPFINNVVVSAKYGVWNFLPRVLLAQVKRPSNMYFLFIALLQTIKEISNTSGIPTILLPLAVVLVCSAIKEALEDRERHRADHVANNRPVMMLTPLNTWEERPWGDLRVGDIVKVMKDQTIPADLLLLSVSGAGHDDDGESQQQLQAATSDTFLGLNDKAQANKNSTESSMYVLGLHNVSQFSGKHQVESDVAYIETKSLDGETNLKIRTVVPLVADICGGANRQSHTFDGGNLNALRGTMVCEQPNNRLTSFEGTFSVILNPTQAQTLKEKSPLSTSAPSPAKYLQIEATDNGFACVHVPVTAKQMLLRSCVLRNTRSVIGMVVFTGHETKVFCSNTEPVVKTSSVERRLNKLIINIVFLQQLVCFLGALFGAYWMYSGGASLWYLVDASERRHHNSASVSATHPLAELVKLHLRYFIIMQNFVPISLNVSLEFVKYWQAYFIEQDLEMYDKQLDAPAIVRSSALNEDLGRVHHIFTDKTGTLTMNLMLFRYLMVGRKHYGGPIQETELKPKLSKEIEQAGLAKGPRFVDFDPTELFADILAGGEQAKMLRHFLRHLALCHTLIPAKSLAEMCSTSFPEYSASSPDEQALVSAAAFCNVRFVHRTSTAMMLMEPGWITPCTYKLLNVIEFESDRKRMSVIVETPDGKIELLCKGADDVIFERLAMDQATKFGGMSCEQASNQLSLYAKAGMRTLCLAYKSIARHEYEKWNARFMEAHASMEDVDKRRHGRANAIDPLINEIEGDLVLLGITAVQDKLQAGVPTTLRLLQETNIKLWTLTGDKMETAVNIGYASALLSHDMDVRQIGGTDYTSIAAALRKLSKPNDHKISFSNQSQILASLPYTNAKDSENSEMQRARNDGHSKSAQTNRTFESARATIGRFLFRTVAKLDRQPKYRRNRAPRASSLFPQTPMYSSVATDADYPNTSPSDEESQYSVGTEADDEALRSPAYGTLNGTGGSHPQKDLRSQKLALVIDGQSLEYALHPHLRGLFYQVTRQCASAVICCRVSPKQKANIVKLIREYEPDSVTLAIGDGANDVAMIQSAHIGVGISGQEGAQAVNASDYALAQFRFLQRLLFVHGRWAYRRVAKLMSYMLYKNVTYVLTTFWFGCFCGFSGQPLILDVAAQSFNVLYTSVPLVLFAVLDQDVSSASATKFPHLYALGQKNVLLARRVFWPWILNGVWHSIIIFFISAWAFAGYSLSTEARLPVIVTETGKSGGLVTLGFVVYTNLVAVVNVKLCLETFMLTWPFLLTVTISILLWFAVGTFISRSSTGFPQATGEMEFLQDLPTFWLVCLLVLSSSLLRDSVWKLVRRFSLPSMYHILQERDLLGLPNSPRRIQREHRHFISNTAWSDGLDTVIDYAKLCKNRSRMESPEEMLMRASPLGERLIVSCSSNTSTDAEIEPQRVIGFQGSEKKRNIRIRGSFQSIGTPDSPPTGMMASFQEPSGSGVVTGFADAPVNSRSYPYVGPAGTYHGYAFSEDENVDSDVETVSARNCRVEKDRAKAAFGAHVSIKKVYKSVRGRKNA